MIAKGNLHAHGAKLAAYLVTGKEDERAELIELRNFAAENIRDAFIDVQIAAEATRCQKPFFHAHVRLPEGEGLDRAEWLHVADRLEKQLGFEGQGRAVAFHHNQLTGEKHLHIAWSRIDLEEMRAIDPGLYKNKLKEISRELEKELGLTQVRNERDAAQRTQSPARNEFEQSRRLGTDITAVRETIRSCWERSDNGKSFEAALATEGYILAHGDRRDFVVIDPWGGDHALGKRITGATAAETRERLGDVDRAHLPSVEEAKAAQAERGLERMSDGPEIAAHGGDSEIDRLAIAAFSDELKEGGRDQEPGQTGEPNDSGVKSPGGVAAGIGGSAERTLGAALDFAADFIAPPPPPTKEQMRAKNEAAKEARERRAERQETDQQLAQTNEMIRTERARLERAQEEERARQRQRERDQSYERDR